MLDLINKPTNKEDFDAQTLVAPIDAHTKEINDLTVRVKALEDKFGTPILIANTLLDTSKEAVKMSEMLEDSFLKLLGKNEPIRDAVKKLISSLDREFVAIQIKKWGVWAGAAIIFIAAQVSIEVIKGLYNHFAALH